jgi:hypothetical protein
MTDSLEAQRLAQPEKRLYEFIRTMRPGGCKAVSLGSDCECPLCDVDRLVRGSAPRAPSEPEPLRAALDMLRPPVENPSWPHGEWDVSYDKATDRYEVRAGRRFVASVGPTLVAAWMARVVNTVVRNEPLGAVDRGAPSDALTWQQFADEFCEFNPAADRVIMHNFAGWLAARGAPSAKKKHRCPTCGEWSNDGDVAFAMDEWERLHALEDSLRAPSAPPASWSQHETRLAVKHWADANADVRPISYYAADELLRVAQAAYQSGGSTSGEHEGGAL